MIKKSLLILTLALAFCSTGFAADGHNLHQPLTGTLENGSIVNVTFSSENGTMTVDVGESFTTTSPVEILSLSKDLKVLTVKVDAAILTYSNLVDGNAEYTLEFNDYITLESGEVITLKPRP